MTRSQRRSCTVRRNVLDMPSYGMSLSGVTAAAAAMAVASSWQTYRSTQQMAHVAGGAGGIAISRWHRAQHRVYSRARRNNNARASSVASHMMLGSNIVA